MRVHHRQQAFPKHESNLGPIKKLEFLRSDGDTDHVDMHLSEKQKSQIEKCPQFTITPWYYLIYTKECVCSTNISRHKILKILFSAYKNGKDTITVSKDFLDAEDFDILELYGIKPRVIKYRITFVNCNH